MRFWSVIVGPLILAVVAAFFVLTPLSLIMYKSIRWYYNWPATARYGNWPRTALSVVLLSAFFLTFARPVHERNWRHLGITEAYFVALFTEMYGIPLTIYLLTSLFGPHSLAKT